jgi:cytochrome P450
MLKELPYLNAVIEESLRLGAPFPGPWRVTPPEGAIVAGQALPGGVSLSVPVWTQHLDPENFRPVPEEFRPERWLPEGLGPDTYTCAAALMAWSYGEYQFPAIARDS